jgi:hypothetical protein
MIRHAGRQLWRGKLLFMFGAAFAFVVQAGEPGDFGLVPRRDVADFGARQGDTREPASVLQSTILLLLLPRQRHDRALDKAFHEVGR